MSRKPCVFTHPLIRSNYSCQINTISYGYYEFGLLWSIIMYQNGLFTVKKLKQLLAFHAQGDRQTKIFFEEQGL